MSIEAQGRPWDQSLYTSIERKGGCHYKPPCSDYIDLERKIQAHELRYADRVEVYGSRTFNGMRITDSVVVLNGGHYMSTGIEKDEDATDINPNRRDPARGAEALDAHVETFAPPPKRTIVEGVGITLSEADEALRESLGMTRAQFDDWNPGGGWSEPRPIDPKDLRRSAVYFAGKAEHHRREARFWAVVAAACLLMMVGVLFIPTDWIFYLFEAFQ